MSPRRRYAAWSGALLLALAGALGVFWQPLSSRLQPAPAPVPLRLAVIDTYIGSGLVLVAAARGHFANEGLAVTLHPHRAGGSALSAVIKHEADMTTVGNLPLIFATLDQAQLSIVASIARAYRGAGILARRDRGISQAADLRGKTIGVTFGTDGHFVLGVILADHGIAASEVNIVNIAPDAIVAALSTGGVDAITTWEPLLYQAKGVLGREGVAFGLDSGFSFWFHLAGRRDYVQQHPAVMQKLLRALLRAEQDIARDPAAAIKIIAAATGMDEADFKVMQPNFSLRLSMHQGMLAMLEDQAQWVLANHYAKPAQMPNFLDSVYLDAMLAVQPDAVSIVR